MTKPSLISKSELFKELSAFATPSTKTGTLLVLRDVVLYWGFIAGVLYAPFLWLKVLFGVLAGFRLASSYTLAHEAAHNALVKNRTLNYVLALIVGIPASQNYRTWTHHHNTVHHPFTNGDQFDYYTPLSKAEYDSLPAHKRFLERVYRSPALVGLWLYFLIKWFPTRIIPDKHTPAQHHKKAWAYTAVLFTYHFAFVSFLAYSENFAPISASEAILLGWLLPSFFHMFLSSLSLYLMHTHINLPWFSQKTLIKHLGKHRPEIVSTVLTLPKFLSTLVNHTYCHAAHHAHAGIPGYKLWDAQAKMNELMGAYLIIEPLSLISLVKTLSKCKLYDYDNHQWLDFRGNPTGPKIDLDQLGLGHLR